VGITEAFWGGFSSFFSIWQICAMQISPFFMAYIIGLYFVGRTRQDKPDIKQWAVVPSLVYVAGFTILYSLLSSSGLLVGRYLSYNLGSLRLVAGIYLTLVSLYLIFPDRINVFRKITGPLALAGLSLLLALSFAVVYSPCITPTLSSILGIANLPETATRGTVLAFFYGLGLSLAFAITGLVLIQLLTRVQSAVNNPARTSMVCGLILSILALLNITGFMTYYKAFVLGLLVQ
jgi:cytochrome c-type biogenesis protein